MTATTAGAPPAPAPAVEAGGSPVVLVAHPSAELYGSDRMLLESVAGMVAAGLDVVVALPGDGPLRPLLEGSGARVVRCAGPVLRKSALRPLGALRLLAATAAGAVRGTALVRRTRPAALYVSTQVVPLWPVLGRVLGVPVVAHVHEAESGAAPLLRRALAAPLLASQQLLVNSAFAGEVLGAALPQLRGRAQVVPNGVLGPPGDPRPPGGEGPVRLLYVGRLSERKGVLVAVAAAADLARRGVDVHLDLVGDVFEEHGHFGVRLDAALTDPALAGRTTRHGFRREVWPYLAASDVLLVPSLLPEPFGNTAVEGVLAGRPVVASATGGLPEAVRGCRSARLVPPGDAAALADAVQDVLADRAGTARQAVADAALLRARHDPGRYRASVVGAVRAVARARGGAPAGSSGEGAAA